MSKRARLQFSIGLLVGGWAAMLPVGCSLSANPDLPSVVRGGDDSGEGEPGIARDPDPTQDGGKAGAGGAAPCAGAANPGAPGGAGGETGCRGQVP